MKVVPKSRDLQQIMISCSYMLENNISKSCAALADYAIDFVL